SPGSKAQARKAERPPGGAGRPGRPRAAAASRTTAQATTRCPSGVRRYAPPRRARETARATASGADGRGLWPRPASVSSSSDGFDTDEGVAFLHQIAVLRDDRGDGAANLGFDFVEDLHPLDDTDNLSWLERLAR